MKEEWTCCDDYGKDDRSSERKKKKKKSEPSIRTLNLFVSLPTSNSAEIFVVWLRAQGLIFVEN